MPPPHHIPHPSGKVFQALDTQATKTALASSFQKRLLILHAPNANLVKTGQFRYSRKLRCHALSLLPALSFPRMTLSQGHSV
jgi:hypothetical protein